MGKISEPIGALWKLFGGVPEAIEKEVSSHLKKLVKTQKGDIHFWPGFGVQAPQESFGKNCAEEMRTCVESTYGEFLKVHEFEISVEKTDDEFNRMVFGRDIKDFKGDIYCVNVRRSPVVFRIYWHFRKERWELERGTD